ncbi:MAG: hypothetical protein U0Q22_12855, partial [Acidimicrobiales bacterium]
MLRVTAVGSEDDGDQSVGAVVSRPELAIVPAKVGAPDHDQMATQEQRRGIGALLMLFGIGLDTLIIAGVPLVWTLYSDAGNGIKRLVFVYTVIAVALLVPTHRKGRLVSRPSELIGPIFIRLALSPMIASALVWWFDSISKNVLLPLLLVTVPLLLAGRLVVFKLVHAL